MLTIAPTIYIGEAIDDNASDQSRLADFLVHSIERHLRGPETMEAAPPTAKGSTPAMSMPKEHRAFFVDVVPR